MPIDALTGQPGAAKTLMLMQKLDEAIEHNRICVEKGVPAMVLDIDDQEVSYAVRPIYVAGVNGFKPGRATILRDPTKWNEIDPDGPPVCRCPALHREVVNEHGEIAKEIIPHAHKIPDGSLILVDEAWQWFGHMHDARNVPTPKHVLDLAIHRHRGLDFIWTFQAVRQIYPFAREVAGNHTYLERLFNLPISTVFAWGKWQDDVDSKTAQERSVKSRWVHPWRKYGSWYKSASVHTMKANIPRKFLLIPLAALFALAMGWVGIRSVFHKGDAKAATPAATTERGNAAPVAASSKAHEDEGPRTAEQWQQALTPVVPGLPFTAPLYAGQDVTTHPQVFCAISGADYTDLLSSRCSCLTEQGTKPGDISDGLCRSIALNGYYDPFKPERRDEDAKPATFEAKPIPEPAIVAGPLPRLAIPGAVVLP